MGLFDVHAHLTDPRLAAIEGELLARAAAAGVTTIISNGLNPADNARVLELAARAPLVRPALGLYPVDAVMAELLALGVEYPREVDGDPPSGAACLDWLEAHAHLAFAIGEIGLDRHWVPEPLWALQEAAFRRAVQIAIDADKPVIVHTRRAEARAFEILVELRAPRVDWHCFGGKVRFAREVAEAGHYFSIPANAERSESFRSMLRSLPRERLLLETDCPYLSPVKGALNEPATVAGTAALAARLWGCAEEQALDQLERNFTDLFGVAP
jgi:TatD DNase family protein